MSELLSVEAEMAVIGAVLVNPDAIAGLVDTLPEEAFGDPRSRAVYRAMRQLWERRTPPDFVTVPAELLAMGGKDKGAALDFLTACRTQEQSWFYAEHYADQVRRLAWRRSIERGGAELVRAANLDGDGLDLDAALLAIRRDADRFSGRALAETPAAEAVDALREETLRRWSGDLIERIVPTGIRMLDRVFLGGFRPDDLIVIAARPSIGKTAFALHLAKRHRALVCSLEMPVKAIWHRLIATEAGVPYELANTAVGDLAARDEWLKASERVASWPLIVRDDLRTTSAIEAEVDRLQREGNGVDLVVIDHLGWLADTFRAGTSQYDRISALSRRCAEAMKRTGVSFVLLSQLNREVEHRPGCVPYLSDLRDSGRVEEDATGIVLLYRRAYYSARNMGGLKPDPEDYIGGQASLDRMTCSVVKNRNGMTTSVDCGWHGRTMRVVDVEELTA